jgi:hypothetical protein
MSPVGGVGVSSSSPGVEGSVGVPGLGISAASFSISSNGESAIPTVPSDHGRLKSYWYSPSSRS